MNEATTPSREGQYQRELEAAQESARKQSQGAPSNVPQKKQSFFDRIGTGRFGRLSRAAMAAGTLASSQPKAPQQPQPLIDHQQTEQSAQAQEADPEKFFGKGSTASEQAMPTTVSANQNKDEEGENEIQNSRRQPQTAGESKSAKAAQGIATAGQVAGRTTQVAAKGAELAGRGTEAISQGVSKGGQALTRAGAELSGTGLGAIAGVPMMIAGGALTATGEAGKAASKGAQKASQTAGQFGQRVAESSKEMKKGLQQAKGTGLGKGKESPLPENVGRILSLRKRQSEQGENAGVVQGAVNAGASLATSNALAWSWRVLIPTFGLTILYVNFHFIARYIAHSEKFCAFGEEWAASNPASQGAKRVPGFSEGSATLEIAEIGGMFLVDFLLALLLTMVFLLGYYVANPTEAINLGV